MSNTVKHTPLNWEIDTENFIVDADGAVVASFADVIEKRDNMEYIVKACNSHHRLIEALENSCEAINIEHFADVRDNIMALLAELKS